MYGEAASFEFHEAVPQSERFAILAQIAAEIDASSGIPKEHSWFTLSLDAQGRGELLVTHPRIWWPAQLALRKVERRGPIRVSKPKNFSADVDESEKERAKWVSQPAEWKDR